MIETMHVQCSPATRVPRDALPCPPIIHSLRSTKLRQFAADVAEV